MEAKTFDFSHLGGTQIKPADEVPDTRETVLDALKNVEIHTLTHHAAKVLLARLKQHII
jgi:hypothetical protein